MTVSSVYEPDQYNGNGVTTVFSVTNQFYDDSDLIVTWTVVSTGVNTVKALTTDYTVTGGDGSTGSITFVSGAPPTGTRVTIEVSLPYTQTADFVDGNSVLAEVVEDRFDKGVIQTQQILSDLNLSAKFPATYAGGLSAVLPVPVDGELLGWSGATGTIVNYSFGDISTSIDTMFSGLAAGDFLVYNGTVWVNSAHPAISQFLSIAGTSTEAAYLLLAEDTDNGTNTVKFQAPALLAGNVVVTLPSVTATLATLAGTEILSNKAFAQSFDINGSTTESGYARFFEDTDNGTNKTKVQAAAALGSDNTVTLPTETGTLLIGTGWVAYTPTLTGFGTPSAVTFFSRRIGDSLEISGKFTSGTSTGVEARASIGFNGTDGNVTIDATKTPNLRQAGTAVRSTTGANNTFILANTGSLAYVNFSIQSSGAASLTAAVGTGIAGSGDTIAFEAKVPITGWT